MQIKRILSRWFVPLLCCAVTCTLLIFLMPFPKTSVLTNQMVQSDSFKVLFLASGPIADQSWDANGFEGYLTIKRVFHVDGDYVENLREDQIIEVVRSHIKQGYTLILGNGSEYGKPFANLAPLYPKVQFIALGGGINGIPNLACPYFQSFPLGYFAGMIAALQTKSNKVGLILAHDNLNEQKGFQMALQKYNSNAILKQGIVGSWNDTHRAVEIAKDMEQFGADVVFSIGDAYNFDVINELRHHHIYTFGYNDDQRFLAPDIVLVSFLQHNDKMLVDSVRRWHDGKLQSGKVPFTYRDGVESLSPFGDMVSQTIQLQVQQIIQDYKSGKFPIPDTVFD